MALSATILETAQEAVKIIYWTCPAFTSQGTVDTNKMTEFLIHNVPNNHFSSETPNTWNSGEEFQVHFLDLGKKETIIFRCTLEITGNEDDYSIVCTLCEPKNKVLSILPRRSAEIARLISGHRD